MTDPSYISKGVIASLAMVSGGTCYWPSPRCRVPVTVNVDGDMILNVDAAHIRGAHPNGPRYDPGMTNEERRQFGNLLLMCRAHHRVIDIIRRDEFTSDQLGQWKRFRERKSYEVLKEVEIPDNESRLQEVLNQAVKLQARELEKQVTRFESALARLAEIDSEAANLVRQRMEAATELREAADKLEHTEDTSAMLAMAGDSLAHTEDTAILLISAADALGEFSDVADQISSAAANLRTAVEEADGAFDDISEISAQLGRKIQELRDLRDDL